LTPAELAGGFGFPGAVPISGRVEESFRRRVGVLPAQTRQLLMVAAADPTGDPGLAWRAAGLLAAVEAGPPDPLRTAEVEHLRGQIAAHQRRSSDGARLLLSAARRLERRPPAPDPPRVVDVLLDAFALRLTEDYAAAVPTMA
jgi:hypothetical protein